MKEQNQEILKKVKKLLSLATSSNKNEAENASKKAQELLLRHNLSIDEYVSKSELDQIEIDSMTKSNVVADVIQILLKDFFFVRCYYQLQASHYKNGKLMTIKTVQMIGTESNIEIAKYVYDYLTFTFNHLWKEYKKETLCHVSAKKSFIYGLYYGLRDKLAEQQRNVLNEYGLVVVPNQALNDYMSTLNLKTKKSNNNNYNSNAANAGKSLGSNININKGVTSKATNTGLSLGE